MKKLIAFTLLLAVIAFGCSQNIGNKSAAITKDCTGDQACIQEAFKACAQAKSTIVQPQATIYGEIWGKTSSGLCQVYLRLDKAEGAPDMVLGKDALCEVDNADPNLDLASIDVSKSCKGPLAEIYQMAKPFMK